MTLVVILILLVLVFGAAWLRGALRAAAIGIVCVVAIGFLASAIEVRPSTIIYTLFAILLVGGLAVMQLDKFTDAEHRRKAREARDRATDP